MTVTRSFAIAATFAAIAVGAASPASAAPVMSGHYVENSTTPAGNVTTSQWDFTPCGDGCAQTTTSDGVAAQARLVNGQWTFDDPNVSSTCPDGSKHPGTISVHYTWDPNTLAGTAQVTDKTATCGAPAGTVQTNNIQFRQAPTSPSQQAPERG
jgi:hypothetical protein